MNLLAMLRKGEGPFWRNLKRLAAATLRFHLPVNSLTRPFFRMLYVLHVAFREGVPWVLRLLWFEPLFRSQCTSVGRGVLIEKPFLAGKGSIIIGDNVLLSGKSVFSFSNRWTEQPQLVIGDNTFVGTGCVIAVAESVRIGRHCLLAGGVSISDYDGHPIDPVLRRTSPNPREAIRPVVIGADVWIGANAKILKGVTIGDRSIIGTGAVVTKSVPCDAIVAGNPARVVRWLVSQEEGRCGSQPALSSERAGDLG